MVPLYLPASQAVQEEASELLYWPAPQAVHEEALEPLYCPALQAVQVASELAPEEGLYLPEPQSVQPLLPVPLVVVYLPTPQAVQQSPALLLAV